MWYFAKPVVGETEIAGLICWIAYSELWHI
jgi:hypothetical protein